MLKLMVIGHLGKDATTNDVNGKKVINFSVAHTEKWTDSKGEKQERTTWVECAYWTDKTAIAPYLTKGKQVFVEGTPEVNTFTRNDGTSGASQKVRVFSLQLLGGATTGTTAAATPVKETASTTPVAKVDDGLPF